MSEDAPLIRAEISAINAEAGRLIGRIVTIQDKRLRRFLHVETATELQYAVSMLAAAMGHLSVAREKFDKEETL